MHALNQGRLSVQSVRGIMGRGFNMGGLADTLSASLMPVRMATGGLAVERGGGGNGNMRPVNINLGGAMFPALATEDTISGLQRYASAKHLRSAGRKPTWHQG